MPRRPSVRRLLGRIKEKVSPTPTVGTEFLPEHHAIAQDFKEIADQGVKLMAAGVVQSWEGALAELARVLEGPFDEPRAQALAERWSDALVGTEQPVSTLTRVIPRTLDRGIAAASRSGQLSDLLRPLEEKFTALPGKVSEGWVGTTAFLEPLFEALEDPSLNAQFAAGGPELVAALSDAAAAFSAAAAGLPEAPDLSKALFRALDAWQGDTLRAFELTIDRHYRLVAAAAHRLESP